MGRRNYYVAAIVGFTVTSALCGTAGSLETARLLPRLARLVRRGLIATGQAIMRDTFPRVSWA